MRTDIDVEQFLAILETLKTSLHQRLEQEIGSLRNYSDATPDTLDAAVKTIDQEAKLVWIHELRRKQDQINEAIQKIHSGTYGICAKCGGEIDSERLKVKPYAKYCIQCKERVEDSRW